MPGTIRVYIRGDGRAAVYRVVKTITLFTSWICLGLFNEVVGPTLPDLKARVNSNYEEISRVLSARSAGLFLGSIFGGFLHDRFTRRRDLLLTVALLLSGLTIAAAPWCSQLWELGVLFHLMGHGHALLTTGGNPTLAFLWADRAAGPFNFLHSGFGFGAAIGPLIARPFLSSDNPQAINSTSHDYTHYNDVTNTTATGYAYSGDVTDTSVTVALSSWIEYPYMIVGVSCFVVALVFLMFYILRSKAPKLFIPDQQKGLKNIFNPGRCTSGNTHFGLQLLILMLFFYMFVVGGERVYGKFLFSYVIDSELQFDKDQAAWLNSVYWISFTTARFIAFILARWVPIHIMLFVQVFGTLASAIGLNIFHNDAIPFWVFSTTMGFFKSPLFPSCLGWANRYMEISSMTVMCVNIGSGVGGMLMQWLTGYMFEYYGPRSFVYILAGYSAMICVIFVVMHLVARRQGERYTGTNGTASQVIPGSTDNSEAGVINMLLIVN